ncbi:MAG: hypothetical protein HY925_08350 [Elusimicrobia bacterium]|nr:hypothetical protein [Elusimicrobiota bacterium]
MAEPGQEPGTPDPRSILSDIEGIQNLQTARMALRWALERLRALEKEAGAVEERRDRLEREFATRRIQIERSAQAFKSQLIASVERRLAQLETHLREMERLQPRPGDQDPAGKFRLAQESLEAWKLERQALFEELEFTRLKDHERTPEADAPSPSAAPADPARDADLKNRLREAERALAEREQDLLRARQLIEQQQTRLRTETVKNELERSQSASKAKELEAIVRVTRDVVSRSEDQAAEIQQIWRKQVENLAAEAYELRRHLEEREADQGRLTARIKALEGEMEGAHRDMARERGEAQARVETVEVQLSAARDTLSHAIEDREQLKARIRELEHAVSAGAAKVDAANSEVLSARETARRQERALTAELTEAAARETALIGERDAARRAADGADARAVELTASSARLELEIQQARQGSAGERAEVQARASALEGQLQASRAALAKASHERDEAAGRVKELDHALESSSQRCRALEGDLKDARTKLLSSEQRLLAEAKANASREGALTAERDAARRAGEAAEAKSKELKLALETLESDYRRIRDTSGHEVETARADAEARALRLQADIDALNDRLREAVAAAGAASDRALGLERSLDMERAQGETTRQEALSLASSLESVRKIAHEHQEALQADLAAARDELAKRREEEDRFENRLSAATARVELLEGKSGQAESELAQRVQEVEALRAALDAEAAESKRRQTKLHEAEAGLAAAELRAQGLDSSFDEARRRLEVQVKDLGEQLASARRVAEEQRARSAMLEGKLATAAAELSAIEKARAEAVAKLEESRRAADEQRLQLSTGQERAVADRDAAQRDAGAANALAHEAERARAFAMKEAERAQADAAARIAHLQSEVEGLREHVRQAGAAAAASADRAAELERKLEEASRETVVDHAAEEKLAEVRAALELEKRKGAELQTRLSGESSTGAAKQAELEAQVAALKGELDVAKTQAAERQKLRADLGEMREKLEPAEDLQRREKRLQTLQLALQEEYRRSKAELEALRRDFLAEVDRVTRAPRSAREG